VLGKYHKNYKKILRFSSKIAAHTKSSLFGASLTIIVTGGKLLLGTWQGIWFTEFDGSRKRKVYVRIMGE